MQPLPLPWVDSLFARMTVRYGSAWLNVWEGIAIDAVKADWASELAGVSANAISYALVNLPLDKPPTLGQFKALCIRAPVYTAPALKAPLADPQRVAEIVDGLRDKLERRKPLQWAYDLQERDKRGESLTLGQRTAWREALTTPAADTGVGKHSPIDPECLPPAMRDERTEQANGGLSP